MKSLFIRFILLFTAGTFVFLGSCAKDEEKEEDPTPSSNFSAKVDGDSFSAVQHAATVDQDHNLVIGGMNSQGSTIVLSLAGFTGEGSFNFSPSSESGAFYTPDTSNFLNIYSTVGENGNGNAVITGWNGTDSIISGTFSFNAEHISNGSTATVTEGVFSSIQVEYESDDTGGGGSNHFYVEIDGTPWEQSGSDVTGISNAGTLIFSAVNTTNSTNFFLTLPSDVALGTHAFDLVTYNIIYTTGTSSFIALSGSITVTEHDQVNNHFEATFSFIGSDSSGNTKNFFNGEISADYL